MAAGAPKFYVYVDWTAEDTPRPFYVGKGTKSRIRQTYRNKKHSIVSKKFGISRKVIVETTDEEEAFREEIDRIGLHNTFHYDDPTGIGCNFTKGGDGVSGYKATEEAKLKRSAALMGHSVSPETRQKFSEARRALLSTGWKPIFPEDAKKVLSEKSKLREARKKQNGYVVSEASRAKMSESQRRRWANAPSESEETRKKRSEAAKSREKNKKERGYKISDTTRAKMSAWTRNPLSEVTKAVMAARAVEREAKVAPRPCPLCQRLLKGSGAYRSHLRKCSGVG